MNNRFWIDVTHLTDFGNNIYLVTVVDNEIGDYVVRETHKTENEAMNRYNYLKGVYNR